MLYRSTDRLCRSGAPMENLCHSASFESDEKNAPSKSGTKQLARAQTFRFLTMLATWALIFAAFFYEPGWVRDSLRFMTHSIESLADQVPEPWGARLEIMLRELGGMIWIQIASAIVLLRLIIWVPFHLWRLRRERRLG